MLINKRDDIMKFLHSYYLFKHIYFISLSVYFSIISAKVMGEIVSKTYQTELYK